MCEGPLLRVRARSCFVGCSLCVGGFVCDSRDAAFQHSTAGEGIVLQQRHGISTGWASSVGFVLALTCRQQTVLSTFQHSRLCYNGMSCRQQTVSLSSSNSMSALAAREA